MSDAGAIARPSAWNPGKVAVFREEFFAFLGQIQINSKELGQCVLADSVYRAQHMALDGIFGGLSLDKHWFDILKSRQLGISTVLRALSLFWLGVHPGLKGYSILDTDSHKEEARLELLSMAENLPPSFRFPRIKRQNRYLLELENGSLLNFASGGVRAGKSSGVLGRSSGVNFCHVSEMCSIDNPEGIESFKNSLAEDFPNRLYLWESTARGFNQRHDMWEETKADPEHKVAVFIGWWAKDNQVIPRSDPDFERYGRDPPTEKELKKIRAVHDLYGWSITPEQLAWVRRKMNPDAKPEGDTAAEYDGSVLRLQEQPWTETDAFQLTGATFFDPEKLAEMAHKHVSRKFKTYSFAAGIEFTDFRVYPAHNQRSIELKVWEEPVEDSVYVVASDVAFGHSEKNDRSAIQVLRCYADGMEQVAEYAWPLINSRQFAWVIATLLGWYAGESSEVYNILEINGPGEATWNELQSLKQQLRTGYLPDVEKTGIYNIFRNTRNYIYNRSDSMGAGHSWQWKTQQQLKVAIMERLRDFTSNGMLWVRSQDTLEEMRSITREGDAIDAPSGKKDDRVFSLAMGVRCWEERARKHLMARRRTRAFEEQRRRLTVRDQIQMFNENMLTSFFAVKNRERMRQAATERRSRWRGR